MKTDTPLEVTGLNPAEAAAAAGQDAVITSDNIAVSAESVETAPETVIEAVPTAVVNDDMSFAEAFAAARAEFGPGASFTWHGQVYGTYYQTEWNAMSPAEQHAFTASALGNGPVNTPLEVNVVDNTDYAAVDDAAIDNSSDEVDDSVIDDDDAEVRVLGYDSYGDDGQQINIAALSVNDEPVIMIDLDNDNVYDYAVADFDNSGKTMDSDNDIVTIDDYNITTDNIADLDGPMDMTDDMAMVDGI